MIKDRVHTSTISGSTGDNGTDTGRYRYLAIFTILIVTVLIYWQVSGHEFIHFDDDVYVTSNPHVQKGLSSESISWAFSIGSSDTAYWHPVTWLSHMLDYELFGLAAGRHHLMNLFFHLINVLLLYILLLRMTGEVWKSAFVSALFALHPINVDSVAWVAERKNLLSTSFWLLTMLAYSSYVRNPKVIRYIAVIVVFSLGLLSKPMLITLPFVLLLMDYWPLKRFELVIPERGKDKRTAQLLYFQGVPLYRLIVEKIPLFLLSILSIAVSAISLQKGRFVVDTVLAPMGLRVQNAVVSFVAYPVKMFAPFNLSFFYPYPDAIPLWQVVGATALLILVSAWALKHFIRAPYLLIGWLWFLGTLIPVSGIVQGGLWPAIAERWAYVPLIGLYLAITWGIADQVRGLRYSRQGLSFFAILVLLVLSAISFRQLGYWKDDMTLFSHGTSVNPKNFVAHTNLGNAYAKQGKTEEAIHHFKQAVNIHPSDVLVLENLGRIYKMKGDQDTAINYYAEAIKYKPDNAAAHYALGAVYAEQGRTENAIEEFLSVVKLNSNNAGAYYNLGLLFANKGEKAKALDYFLSALRIDPADAESHCALGVVMMNQGMIGDAVAHFKEASRIDPNSAVAGNYLKAALDHQEKRDKEISSLEQNLLTNPDDPAALYKLAAFYSSKNQNDKALAALYKLRDIRPENPDTYYNIACIYAKENRAEESIDWLGKALDKGFRNRKLLMSDRDLENIRNTQGYKRLIQQ